MDDIAYIYYGGYSIHAMDKGGIVWTDLNRQSLIILWKMKKEM